MRIALRAVFTVALLAACWRVVPRLLALETVHRAPGIDGLEAATRLDPDEPHLRLRLGLAYRGYLEARDLDAARRHLTRATELNPWHPRYRRELALLLEVAGEPGAAREELERAVAIDPRSAPLRWQLAHLQLRTGDAEAALTSLRAGVALDPALLGPAVGALARGGLPLDRLQRLAPPDAESQRRLLEAVLAAPDLSVDPAWAAGRWRRLLLSRAPSLRRGEFYPRWLARSGQAAAAREAWSTLARRNGIEDPSYTAGDVLAWNGDFELPIAQAGLGWVANHGANVRVERQAGTGIGGSTALLARVEEPAGRRPRIVLLRQLAALRPAATHDLIAWLAIDKLGEEVAVRITVSDACTDVRLAQIGPLARATGRWQTERVRFATSPGCDAVTLWLWLQRPRGSRAPLKASFRLDQVRIDSVEPPASAPVP